MAVATTAQRCAIHTPADDDDDDARGRPRPRSAFRALVPPRPCQGPTPEGGVVGRFEPTVDRRRASDADADRDATGMRLRFSTTSPERFAVVQSRVAMFPYRSWHVRPTPPGSNAPLSSTSSSVIVSVEDKLCPHQPNAPAEFEVGDGWARLANADELARPDVRRPRDARRELVRGAPRGAAVPRGAN